MKSLLTGFGRTAIAKGVVEAFYFIEGWKRVDSRPQGIVKVENSYASFVFDAKFSIILGQSSNARRKRKCQDPRQTCNNVDVIYFRPNNGNQPQFVYVEVESACQSGGDSFCGWEPEDVGHERILSLPACVRPG